MSAPATGAESALEERPWPLPWEAVEGDRDGLGAHLEHLAARAAIGGLARLPRGLQVPIVRLLARVARRVDRRHANAARRFLDQALGPELDPERREALVLASYENLFLMTLEMDRIDAVVGLENVLEHCDVQVTPEVERVLAAGTGALILMPHLGVFELLSAVGTRIGFRPGYVVSRPPRNRPLSRFAQVTREAHGVRLLHRHGAAQSVPRAIAGGAYVGLLVDQRAHKKTVLAPFFGRQAHCERGVAVFAKRLGVPLVFAACYRTERPWHYRAEFGPVLWPEDLAGESLVAITTRINAQFERMIRACPEQYFWLHDRYRGAPPSPAEVEAG